LVRILIADDHAILRRGLRELLLHELAGALCCEVEDGQQVLAQIHRQAWDLVILDLSMPGATGIEVLHDLKQLRPKLPVLVLSMHPEDQYGKRVLRAGAAGYLNKECAPEELVRAARKVLGGGRYVSPSLAEKLAADLSPDAQGPPHERLSDREFEVMRSLAAGRTVSQIADNLRLSVTTVSTYRARILEKMSMASNAELMRYAIENKLVD